MGQARQMYVPDIAAAVGYSVQFYGVAGVGIGRIVKQKQPDSSGMAAKNGKVDATIGYCGPVRGGRAGSGLGCLACGQRRFLTKIYFWARL